MIASSSIYIYRMIYIYMMYMMYMYDVPYRDINNFKQIQIHI